MVKLHELTIRIGKERHLYYAHFSLGGLEKAGPWAGATPIEAIRKGLDEIERADREQKPTGRKIKGYSLRRLVP